MKNGNVFTVPLWALIVPQEYGFGLDHEEDIRDGEYLISQGLLGR